MNCPELNKTWSTYFSLSFVYPKSKYHVQVFINVYDGWNPTPLFASPSNFLLLLTSEYNGEINDFSWNITPFCLMKKAVKTPWILTMSCWSVRGGLQGRLSSEQDSKTDSVKCHVNNIWPFCRPTPMRYMYVVKGTTVAKVCRIHKKAVYHCMHCPTLGLMEL